MDNGHEASFSKIWFLESENTFENFKLSSMDDVGELRCTEGELFFKGKAKAKSIRNIKSLSFCKQGRDFVNNWIRITFDEYETSSKSVYVAGGRFLGWAGILGGTKRMYKKLSKALSVH